MMVCLQVLSTDIDLLHPPADLEKQKHKTKRLVQSPNSFFMDVKCQGCFQMYDPTLAVVSLTNLTRTAYGNLQL